MAFDFTILPKFMQIASSRWTFHCVVELFYQIIKKKKKSQGSQPIRKWNCLSPRENTLHSKPKSPKKKKSAIVTKVGSNAMVIICSWSS